MDCKDLVASGQLKEETTSAAKLAEFMQLARDEIRAATFNLEKFPMTAYKSAYDAMMHAGNALIRSYGYRPTAKHTHVTITVIVERSLGKECGDLARSFKRMRRKRHPLQYEAVFSESYAEVKKSIVTAKKIVKIIASHIGRDGEAKELL